MTEEKHTDEGYIILARSTYKDSKTWQALTPIQKVVMLTLIMMANHKDGQWWDSHKKEWVLVKRGQLITSLKNLKKACGRGISIRNIRTAIVNLENMGFLTNQSTKQYRLITIVNYDFYQCKENYLTKQLTKHRQSTDKALTINNNDNNDKNDKKEKDICVEFVNWFNSVFGKNHKPSAYREKVIARLKAYTVDQLKQACLNMKRDPFMMGSNDRNKVYATLEYITRNDKNVDKWLNQVPVNRREVIR